MDKRYEAFVGKNITYYEEAWKRKRKWNWASFFLTLYWLGYRKMYKHIFVTIAIWFAVLLLYSYTNPAAIDSITFVLGLITMFVFGMNGNNMYKKKAEKTIIHMSQLKLEESEEIRELTNRGGTSIFGIFLVWVILILVIAWSS
jgi:hypothetical protein